MRKLIGDKNVIAVEFKQFEEDERMGYAKIWFGRSPLGTNEDLIFKSYLIQGLKNIENSDPHMPSSLNKEDLYLQLKSSLQNGDVFTLSVRSFGTFCDDYTVFSFINGNIINILWKLENTDTPFSDLNSLTQVVYHFTIDKNLFSEQTSAITKEINYGTK